MALGNKQEGFPSTLALTLPGCFYVIRFFTLTLTLTQLLPNVRKYPMSRFTDFPLQLGHIEAGDTVIVLTYAGILCIFGLVADERNRSLFFDDALVDVPRQLTKSVLPKMCSVSNVDNHGVNGM